MKNIRFRQKAALVLLGIALALLLLEAGLRSAGYIFLSLQENKNKASLKETGAYRIVCIGESTTALGGPESYPRQLQDVLNDANTGVRFSVINKGIPGTNSNYILSQLEGYISKYGPDMIISMMGINDKDYHYINRNSQAIIAISYLESFRVYKLARLLKQRVEIKAAELSVTTKKKYAYRDDGMILTDRSAQANSYNEHMKAGIEYIGLKDYAGAIEAFNKAMKANTESEWPYYYLGLCYDWQSRYNDAKKMFKRALWMNPDNEKAHCNLGINYIFCGQYDEAQNSLLKAIEIKPDDKTSNLSLGQYYVRIGRLEEAIAIVNKLIRLNPDDYELYVKIGEFYGLAERLDESEEALAKAIQMNPERSEAYYQLGRLNLGRDFARAAAMLEKAGAKEPHIPELWIFLGWAYAKLGEYAKAEALYKGLIADGKENHKVYAELGWCYKAQGRHDESEAAFKRAACSEYLGKTGQAYSRITRYNYQRLKEITSKRKIQLVCVQYPLRDIGQLKEALGSLGGVIFVDNNEVFRRALEKGSYDEFFLDQFGQDFGHCTPKGNRLLAQNVATVILKEKFGDNAVASLKK